MKPCQKVQSQDNNHFAPFVLLHVIRDSERVVAIEVKKDTNEAETVKDGTEEG
jgi:hypothetical protein